jgi:hypothetical protein
MKPLTIGISAFVVFAMLTAIYMWPRRAPDRAVFAADRHAPTALTGNPVDREFIAARASSGGGLPIHESTNYKKLLAESHNYWNFAHKTLPAAQDGDANAQYYLSKSLEYCKESNEFYFEHKGKQLTFDEGLQYAAKRNLPYEIAQEVYEKCHEFKEHASSELGNAADWLAKATDSRQPVAQATTASKMLMQDLQQNLAKSGGVLNPNKEAQIGNGADPRELLRAAVQSREPEVLFSIGEAQGLLDPLNSDKNTNRFAWWLVACQRGFDCSATADWVKVSCGNDPQCASANSPSDLVRSLAGDSWPGVQQRAQEISAKLDAGQWSALGLGS